MILFTHEEDGRAWARQQLAASRNGLTELPKVPHDRKVPVRIACWRCTRSYATTAASSPSALKSRIIGPFYGRRIQPRRWRGRAVRSERTSRGGHRSRLGAACESTTHRLEATGSWRAAPEGVVGAARTAVPHVDVSLTVGVAEGAWAELQAAPSWCVRWS